MKSVKEGKLRSMYCVIVGDIVGSRELPTEVRIALTLELKSIFGYINTKYADNIVADFGLVRGDAFEGIMYSQADAPAIIQMLIKRLYNIDKTRIRICTVMDYLTVVSSDRNESDGAAFYKATAELDNLKQSDNGHWFQVSFLTSTFAQPLVNSLIELMSALTSRWTDKQREIVWAMEDCNNQQKIAALKLGLAKSVVKKQLAAAHYDAYYNAWRGIERFIFNFEHLPNIQSVTGRGGSL